MRIGGKQRPFYRVVAVDERAKRTGAYIELLGTYNPLSTPKEIILKQDRIDHWVKQGAQMSDGFLRIIGKAPQRPARGPKKKQQERNEKAEAGKTPAAEKVEETAAEAPAETPAPEQGEETASVTEEVAPEVAAPVEETPTTEPETVEPAPAEEPKEEVK